MFHIVMAPLTNYRELPGSDQFPDRVTTFRTISDYKKLAEVAEKNNAHVSAFFCGVL